MVYLQTIENQNYIERDCFLLKKADRKWLAAPRILTVTTTSTRFLRERMTSRRVVSATMRLL